MDTTAEKHRLENEKAAIQQYLDHPISRKIFQDNAAEQEQLMIVLCDIPITDLESLIKRFEAVGHLRGLRRAMSLIKDDVEIIEEQLKAYA